MFSKIKGLEANYKTANVSLAPYDGNASIIVRLPTAEESKISTSLFSKHVTVAVEFQIR